MKHLFSLIPCLLASALVADQVEPSKSTYQEIKPIAEQCAPEACKTEGISYGFFGEFLYLQPNGSNFYYAVQADGLDENITVPAANANWKAIEIDPSYHCGFEIGANVRLIKSNVNMMANWERLHGHDTDSYKTSSAAGFMVGPIFDIGPNSAAYKLAKGKISSHFDEVNLVFGKQLCFFNNFHTQFYAGASFARIKQTLGSKYSNSATSITRSVGTFSKFTGAGPQVGLDYGYRIFNHLFFSGNTALSLIMGQMKNGTTFKSTTPELAALDIPEPNTQTTKVPSRSQLVPGFEQKIGFSYLPTWKCIQGLIEIGYRCQIYVNAVQTFDMTAPQVLPAGTPVTPDVGVFAVGFERTISNFMLSGLYATLGIEF
ncbi:MAG: Lpg1974 family pore-forming outer membrane protein [Chlamydiota bacterium]